MTEYLRKIKNVVDEVAIATRESELAVKYLVF